MTNADFVRLLTGERIPEGGSEADTFFTNAEVADLLAASLDNVQMAASLGWRAKAAEFAKYIDIDESGSTRKMSQMYRQAVLQADHFEKIAGEGADTRQDALRSGIVAKSAPWAIPADAPAGPSVLSMPGRHRA
jgi:hypothetical protein